MLIEDVKRMTPFEQFCYWIKERHNIHLKRKAGRPKPWTDDVVLQSNFFTNPFRENDKVTQWFKKNVRDPLWDDPGVVFAVSMLRWFNWIPTCSRLVEEGFHVDWNWKQANKFLKSISDSGEKVFTGAFLISPAGSTKPKIQRVCQDFIDPLWRDRDEIYLRMVRQTLEEGWKVLHEYPGLSGGGFMAYEVVCDLQYTHVIDADDAHTWTNLGPGGKRGLNRVLGQDIKTPLGGKKTYLPLCVDLLKRTRSALKKTRAAKDHDIDMRTIEHSLCEYDKYARVLYGQGRSKRTYDAVSD